MKRAAIFSIIAASAGLLASYISALPASPRITNAIAANVNLVEMDSWHTVMSTINSLNAADNDFLYVPIYTVQVTERQDVLTVSSFLKIGKRISNLEKLEKVIEAYSTRLPAGSAIVIKDTDSTPQSFILDLRAPGEKIPGSDCVHDYWYDRFQGSTGGLYTSLELTMNFLQPTLGAQWPDSVYFRHSGGLPNFEHAPDFCHITRTEIEANLRHFFRYSNPTTQR